MKEQQGEVCGLAQRHGELSVGEIAVVEIKKRLEIFEQTMKEVGDLGGWMGDLSHDIVVQRQSLEEFQTVVMNSIEVLKAQVEEFHTGLEKTKSVWALCKKTVASGVLNINATTLIKVEVLIPRRYRGKWDAQEIEKFLWSVERYFEATNVQGE